MRTVLLGVVAICALSIVTISGCERGDDQRDAVAVSTAALAADTNLVANPSVETPKPGDATKPEFWDVRPSGTNTRQFIYDATTANTGSRSVRVDISAWTSGDAAWKFDPITVTPGATYIYRDYYKATIATTITVLYRLSTDSVDHFQTIKSGALASASWTSGAYSWTAPANATTATVLHRLGGIGTLWLDDVSFGLPQTPDLSSGVPNGDLEQTSDLDLTKPLAWAPGSFGTNQPTYAYEQTGHSGTHSLSVTMTNYVSGDAKWVFAAQPVTPGVRYLYSDFYRATVPTKVTAQFNLTDGTTQSITVNTVPASAAYVQAYGSFLAPDNAVSVTVFHRLDQNGFLQIDDAALSPLPPATLINGVPNGDLEQSDYPGANVPTAWHTNRFGTNTTAFTYVTDPNTGNHSARIDVTAYTDGAASWNFDPQPVQPGKAYRITATYRSDFDMNWVATVQLTDNSIINLQLPAAFASPTEWASYSAKVYLPDNAVNITVYDKISRVGWVEIDDVGCELAPTAPFTRGLVSLTFDDAYLSDAQYVLPVLEQHDAVATHYILTGALGDPGRMTLAELAALAGAGDQIAGHTVTHRDLTTLSPADLATELSSSKLYLESLGYDPLLDFATPYGAYNEPVLAAIKAAYRSHRTVDAGYNSKDDWNIYGLKVQNMRSTTTQAEVDGWAARAAADHSWLIIVYHDVVTDLAAGSIYSTTPASLDAHLTSFENHGLAIVTVEQAIDEILPQLVCDDQNVCTTDVLGQNGYCSFTNNTLSCDDADACTVGESCSGADCVPSGTLDCGLYGCSSTSGCKTTCATGNDCSTSGYCKPGACVSSCDDGDPCTDDQADADRTCASTVRGDGSDCGEQAQCWSGFCRDTCDTVADCSAGLLCSAGLCTANCDDGNPCTTDTVDPDGVTCAHTPLQNGSDCTGANKCQPAACTAGSCVALPAVVCPPLDQCHVAGACNRSTGVCSNPTAPDGTSCDDGNLCTAGDSCQTGACGGAQISCDDANVCTLDGCNPAVGCSYTPGNAGIECRAAAGACDASEACTGSSALCPTDQFQAATVTCRAASDACDSAEQCTGTGATCPADSAVSCGLYACDTATGCETSCVTGAECASNAYCNAGSCASSCDDGNACTDDTADANGTCSSTVKSDGASCGTQAQCSSGFCRQSCGTAADCSAGQVCTAGLCAANCQDNNPCTTDTLDASGTTCSHSAVADGTSCTGANRCQPAACGGGTCIAGPAVVCAALDQCHLAGVCDPGSGVCSNPIRSNGTSCNDGSLCTTGDACNAGACVGAARNCADTNVCTVDSCDPTLGCVNAPGNAGTVCRASTGVCDAAETCTGSAAACPANLLQPATFTCRAASSACDSPETCTGTSASCPAAVDRLAPTLSPGTNQTVLGSCSSLGNVSYVYPTASNAASGQCDSPPRVTCTSIGANNFGPHTVSCTARDSIGNVSNTVSFTVTVLEPLSVSLQSPLASPPTNNVARVGWTVLHSVKLFNCRLQNVTATAAVGIRLTTSMQNGLPIGVRSLSASTATPNTNGVMVKVGTGSSTTYQYKLGTTGMQTTGSGSLFDTRYWLSTMTASYTSAPTISAGATTARIALTP